MSTNDTDAMNGKNEPNDEFELTPDVYDINIPDRGYEGLNINEDRTLKIRLTDEQLGDWIEFLQEMKE